MRHWSIQEDAVLRENWSLACREIAALLNGRTIYSVRHRRKMLRRKDSTPKPTPIQCSEMDIEAGAAVFRAGVK